MSKHTRSLKELRDWSLKFDGVLSSHDTQHILDVADNLLAALDMAADYLDMAVGFVRSNRDKKAMAYRAYECRAAIKKATTD